MIAEITISSAYHTAPGFLVSGTLQKFHGYGYRLYKHFCLIALHLGLVLHACMLVSFVSGSLAFCS